MLENLLSGFVLVAQWQNLLAILVGALLGYFVGALPGLGPAVSVALLLPFTYDLSPLTSLALLTALYGAAEYAGSITAVTINVPGEASATPTTFDGYQLTLKGMPAKALGISMMASFYAGTVSTLALFALSVPLANVALKFGPPEYFALGLFGLTVVASLAGKSWVKGTISVLLGLLITSVGLDPITGMARYAYVPELYEGIPLIPALVGLFAISEVLVTMEEVTKGNVTYRKISGALPTLKEYLSTHMAMLRGTIIGFLIGVIPGAGKAIASFIAYNEEKRVSKHPEKFGTGVLEGVAAPEAANNAVVSGALVPLLALGIPGSATAAVLIGAFMIHGLLPGPMLFVKNPDLVYGLFAALLVGNVFMLAIGLLGTQLWARVLTIPKYVLMPIVLAVSLFAAYAESNDRFTMWLAVGFGVVGYFMRRFEFPVSPVVLAMVLGDMMESSLRRTLIISGGKLTLLFTRPVALSILLLTALSVGYQVYRAFRTRKTETAVAEPVLRQAAE
ncbi:tripartite tricarboxylate transporter permease [Caldinitratiruptor microaerophilus]|uniref:DUF112 domain-containing protein n=1 Tax=Caldinitratiruptor microaerophilus TaxID=671077 RepID=A0AA35G6N0_9FIRM|nr:tripartite tricarboxylate transporter permease [Caldinitratiruptor microaerophilus]BDG59181.1 hypothetical protein caldi_02710 [Caldinitratiruptor microaerophilus]